MNESSQHNINAELSHNSNDINNQIGTVITKTEQFIEKNKKILIITVSAIVFLVLIFCLYKFWYLPSEEKNAENEMFAAEYYFMQEDYEKALKGDGKHAGLISVCDDYGRTKHGKLAKFYVGRIYLEQGKYQDAIDYLKDFNPHDAFMSSLSKSLIADCYWEMNNIDKAISYYNDAVKSDPNNFTTPAILIKLGTAYEVKKDFKKALECYNKIKKDFPRSPEFAQIEKYISRAETILAE